MQKRIWITLLFAVLLAGCAAEETEEEPVGEEYVHISLFMGVEFWHGPEWDISEGTVTGDISEATGLVVDVMPCLEDPNRQMSLMLVNDELPDVISVTDGTVIGQLASSGKVWELEEFLETYRPDSHILRDFPEDMKYELTKRDGGWYAWPSHIYSRDAKKTWKAGAEYRELADYGDNRAIMWNRKLLEQLGISTEELHTEEQVLAALEKAGRIGELIPLLIDGDAWTGNTLEFLQQTFGAEYVDDNGEYLEVILQPESRDALYFLNKAMRNGYADADQMTMSNDQVKEALAGGNVLCFIGNMANTAVDMKEWFSSGAILPSSGKIPVFGKEQQAATGWISTFISKDCSHPEQIAAWLDYMTSEEGMMRWWYGEEGVHYIRNDQGLVSRTKAGEEAENNYTQSGVAAWWMFVNTAWMRSVLAPYEEGSSAEAEAEIQTAYGKDPNTVLYNRSLVLNLLQNDSDAEKYEELEQWEKAQLSRVVLAPDDERFAQEYEALLEGLAERGIMQLNQAKNKSYQKKCLEYGEKIERVNRTEEP